MAMSMFLYVYNSIMSQEIRLDNVGRAIYKQRIDMSAACSDVVISAIDNFSLLSFVCAIVFSRLFLSLLSLCFAK